MLRARGLRGARPALASYRVPAARGAARRL